MPHKDAAGYQRKQRRERKALGLCCWGVCENPLAEGHTRYCEKHARADSRFSRARRKRARNTVLSAFGGKCTRCGQDDQRVLQLDHVNGTGAEERKNHSGGSFWIEGGRGLRYVLEHPKEYQLLCANCHIIKGLEHGDGLPCRWCEEEAVA